jgi:hypothetical protein
MAASSRTRAGRGDGALTTTVLRTGGRSGRYGERRRGDAVGEVDEFLRFVRWKSKILCRLSQIPHRRCRPRTTMSWPSRCRKRVRLRGGSGSVRHSQIEGRRVLASDVQRCRPRHLCHLRLFPPSPDRSNIVRGRCTTVDGESKADSLSLHRLLAAGERRRCRGTGCDAP